MVIDIFTILWYSLFVRESCILKWEEYPYEYRGEKHC